MRIGVLALQGGFSAHAAALEEIGAEPIEVRAASDFARIEGLVLPGGESSVQLALIERFDLGPALVSFAKRGLPILATCAGLILIAKEVRAPEQPSFGLLDVAVSRNAWGRQVDSFEARADESALPLVFIRAPRIVSVGSDVDVRATLDGEPIWVRQGAVHGMCFHPELTRDRRVHQEVFAPRMPLALSA
jgi:5'-phosphate synthase pdxT subunit